jgi:hypothetical protein
MYRTTEYIQRKALFFVNSNIVSDLIKDFKEAFLMKHSYSQQRSKLGINLWSRGIKDSRVPIGQTLLFAHILQNKLI